MSDEAGGSSNTITLFQRLNHQSSIIVKKIIILICFAFSIGHHKKRFAEIPFDQEHSSTNSYLVAQASVLRLNKRVLGLNL